MAAKDEWNTVGILVHYSAHYRCNHPAGGDNVRLSILLRTLALGHYPAVNYCQNRSPSLPGVPASLPMSLVFSSLNQLWPSRLAVELH